MHKLIRVLVFAQNESEALDAARRIVLDKLVGESPDSSAPYDSAVDFTGRGGGQRRRDEIAFASLLKQNGKQVAVGCGENRFGDIPAVLQVSTKRFPCEDPRGMEQVKEAMDAVREQFKFFINGIRELATKHTDEDLLPEGKEGSCFRRYCLFITGYDNETFLYDDLGKPISDPRYLEALLTDIPEYHDDTEDPEFLKMISQKLWVVPFDVHSSF